LKIKDNIRERDRERERGRGLNMDSKAGALCDTGELETISTSLP